MAGLYRLKILLLWAGLMELAICEDHKLAASISATTSVTLAITPTSTSTTTSSASGVKTDATSDSSTSTSASTAVNKTQTSDPASTTKPNFSLPSNHSTSQNLTSSTTSTPPPQSKTLPASTPTFNTSITSAPSDSSTKASASTAVNQTQTSDPASTTNQNQSLPSTHSTSQNNTWPTSTPHTQNQTIPASTPTLNTTITSGNPTTTPPPKCSYTVTAIKYGFQVNITNLSKANVTISYKENNDGKIQNRTFNHSQKSFFHDLKELKHCTNYTVKIDEPNCEIQGNNNLTTWKMDQKDINPNTTIMPGHICYNSDWDISETIKPNKYKNRCFMLESNDFCSNFTTSFESSYCEDSKPINIETYIPIESFMEYRSVELLYPDALPAKLKWVKRPLNCMSNLTINYTCQEPNKNQIFSELVNFTDNNTVLPELEPFTEYNCTSRIYGSNRSIEEHNQLNIVCDLDVIFGNVSTTNTSISLKWTTLVKKCPKSVLSNITFECCCKKVQKDGKEQCESSVKMQCDFHNVQAFTQYSCSVKPAKYKGKVISSTKTLKPVETAIGVPGNVTPVVTLFQNNGIRIKCDELKDGLKRGPEITYHASITSSNQEKKKGNKCEFTFENLSYLTTYTVEVFTKNKQHQSDRATLQITTRYNDKALIGFLIFLIMLTCIALIFVLYKIFILQRKKSRHSNIPLDVTQTNDENSLLNVEPIGSEMLLDAYKKKIADEGRLFLQEFQSIPRIFSRNLVREAKKSCNQPKNRYVDILPYDYNRVQLTTGNGEAGCDYINASFIDGFKESKKYIAAQGPKEETVGDFWRMVWEQQSSIIVMVTRCEEGNRVKCAQYWPSPEREAEIFEEFIVKLNGQNRCPDYTIRHLSLANKREKSAEREVTHIQFTSWPDHGVPGEPHLLLKLRRRVNSFKNFFSGPIVIHCSAGVGRTGTYMGIDAMMEGLESEGRVDVYGYVVRLRRQRCLMVQVEAQYILIHQALIEHNQFGETEIPLTELHSTLSTLKQKEPSSEPTLIEVEFQRLPWYKNWRTFNTGVDEDNKKKNRYSSVIPYDYNRVLVKLEDECSHDQDDDDDEEDDESSDEEDESTKYINASHIDGYWCQKSLIATQGPLADTIGDFWQMLFQKKVKTIVMLTGCKEGEQEFCSPYWGDKKRTFGDIEVEVTATETLPTYTTRSIQIRHTKRKETRQMKQYHFLKWAGRELPEMPQDFMDMIKNIKQTCGYGNGKPEKILPVVVHCNDGSSRSGIFCALWNIMDSAETEKLVDVFQVAKSLRKERQGMINSLEQYQFLYEAVEGAFPVQNGEVKHAATTPSGVDSVQVINENKPEQPVSTPISPQQQALVVEESEESTPLVAEAGKVTDEVAAGKEDEPPGSPTEKTPLGEGSNGPLITVDV